MKGHQLHLNNIRKISHCGKEFFRYSFSEYLKPYAIEKTDGEHSLESCENCKKVYDTLIKQEKERLDKFPLCCDEHAQLPSYPEYSRTHFENAPTEIANKIIFTHHHIINNIKNENWKEEIFDYIHYGVDSFGSFPYHLGSPYQLHRYFVVVSTLTQSYKTDDYDPINKKEYKKRVNAILDKINWYYQTISERESAENILLSTYDKWFKIFPFELPYFSPLKEGFSNIIPLYKKNDRVNKYLNKPVKEVHTTSSLADVLTRITTNILTTINAQTLFDKGELTKVEKIELELIKKKRIVEVEELKRYPNSNKQEYIKILKTWIKGEKEFVSDIKPFLPKETEQKKKEEETIKPTKTQVILYYIYLQKAKIIPYFENHPIGKIEAIEELIKKDGIDTTKNYFQKVYNKFTNHPSNRIARNQVNNIQFVIDHLLNDHPKAMEIAKEELNQAITKNR